MNYVRKLGFEESPDYDFLRELFTKIMRSNGDVEDGVYDWNTVNSMFIILPQSIHLTQCLTQMELVGKLQRFVSHYLYLLLLTYGHHRHRAKCWRGYRMSRTMSKNVGIVMIEDDHRPRRA